jgi:hypothetical protein
MSDCSISVAAQDALLAELSPHLVGSELRRMAQPKQFEQEALMSGGMKSTKTHEDRGGGELGRMASPKIALSGLDGRSP